MRSAFSAYYANSGSIFLCDQARRLRSLRSSTARVAAGKCDNQSRPDEPHGTKRLECFVMYESAQKMEARPSYLQYQALLEVQEQLTQERDRMRLLLEVNNAIVSHLDLDDLFTAVSAGLRKVIQNDSSGLVLCDQETGWFRVHVLHFAKNESFIEEGQIESDGCMKSPAAVAAYTRKPAVFSEEDLKTMAAESPCAQY